MPSQLILDYFASINFDIWEKKINHCLDQIIKLKKESSKYKYYIELYAIYLQLVEIFCRNGFTLTEENTKYILKMKSSDITAKAEVQFKSKKFMNYLLDNWVFGLKNKSKIRNCESKRRFYDSVLTEAVLKDYCKHYQFVNAYKHGFRVYASGKKSLAIGKESSNESIIVKSFNAHVCCFYSEEKEKQLYKMEIFFDWQNVGTKALVVLCSLQNMRKVYLAQGGELSLDHLFITDHESIIRHSGRGTIIIPIENIS